MTVINTTAASPEYTASGADQAFNYDFFTASLGELLVFADGVELDPGEYVVVRASDGTGSVRPVPPLAPGAKVRVASDPDFTQQRDFQRFGGFSPDHFNGPLDLAAARDIYLKDLGERSVRVGPGGQGVVIENAGATGDVLALTDDGASWQDRSLFKGDKGDPGGNVASVGPRAVVGGLTVPLGTDLIIASGGSVSSDLGFSVLTIDAEQTTRTALGTALISTAVGRGQSSPSATAAVDAMESRIRAKDLGNRWFRVRRSLGDHRAFALTGDTDRMTLQAAIDLAHYWKQPLTPLGAGGFTIDAPVWLARGDAFRQISLIGSGMTYGGTASISTGTLLTFTDTQLPGLIAQGFRKSQISRMTLKGPHYATMLPRNLGNTVPNDGAGGAIDDTPISVWYTMLGLTQKRYAPNAAVVFDPFVLSAPGGAGVLGPYVIPSGNSQPDWLGPLALYGRSSSSDCSLVDVEILGWEIGLAINPSTANYQTDFITSDRLQITYCITAISSGPDQGRLANHTRLNVSTSHTVLANTQIGTQKGRYAGTISGTVAACIRLMDLNLSLCGTLTFHDFYAETMWKLGDVTASTYAGVGALQFIGSELGFTGHPAARGTPDYLLGSATLKGAGFAYAPVTFIGGQVIVDQFAPILARRLTITNLLLTVISASNGQLEAASGTPLAIADNTERKLRKMAHNACLGLVTPNMQADDHQIIGAVYDVDLTTNSYLEVRTNGHAYNASNRKHCIPHWQREAQPWGYSVDSPINAVTMPRKSMSTPKSAMTGWVALSGKRIGFTLPAYFRGASEFSARNNNIAPGRLVYDSDTGMVGWVVSINWTTGDTVVQWETNLNQPVGGGGAYAYRTAFSTTAGSLYFVETGFFMPAITLVGDVTAGSAVVTNLRGPAGETSWLTNATYAAGHPQTGDWLYANIDDTLGSRAPFRSAAAKIVAFDGAARTMTMASNPSIADTTGVVFPLFRRGE